MAGRSDVELLEDLLALEQRLVSTYEAALRRDVIAPELGRALRDQEREHVHALEQALAGAGRRNPRAMVPSPELGAVLRDRDAFVLFALDLEEEAVGAYAQSAAEIRNPRLRQPLGSIMACEAAHAVVLREARRAHARRLGERLRVDYSERGMGFISTPGPLELMVILVIALIVLGPQKLPEAARSVGRGMRELKESLTADDDEKDAYDYEEPREAKS